MITCPYCSTQLDDSARFCFNCGTPIANIVALEPNVAAPQPNITKKRSRKKIFLFGGIGITAIAIALLVIFIISRSSLTGDYGLYFKDNEIFYTNATNGESMQLTMNLFDDDDNDEHDLKDASSTLGYFCTINKDGSIIFFPDKSSSSDDGFNLYYRHTNKQDEDPIKIDSDLRYYSVNHAGDRITYIKSSDKNLYQHDLENKEKIASNVQNYMVSDDGERITYLNEDGRLYLKVTGKESEKVANDVTQICYVTEDLSCIYYLKDNNLYKKCFEKEPEKITSDVSSVLKVYDSGQMYYLKSTSKERTLADYVEDDKKDTDATITEPVKPDYPYYWRYDTYTEYLAAENQYEQDLAQYEVGYVLYQDKLKRDQLREELNDETLSSSQYTLCYYNGTEEKSLTDAYVSKSNYNNIASTTPAIAYSVYKQTDVSKLKLSEISSISEVKDMVESALYSSSEPYIALEDVVTMVDQSDADYFVMSDDGKTIYFLDNQQKEGAYGDLYQLKVSDNKLGKAELYDSDVYTHFVHYIADGKLAYYKDIKDNMGEFYINKEKIDDDVYTSYVSYVEEDNRILYYVDYDKKSNGGTLRVYDTKKTKTISDDVFSYLLTPNGNVLYLYDYSIKGNYGELFLYKSGEAQKIADDVSGILPIYDNPYKGLTYFNGD